MDGQISDHLFVVLVVRLLLGAAAGSEAGFLAFLRSGVTLEMGVSVTSKSAIVGGLAGVGIGEEGDTGAGDTETGDAEAGDAEP